MERTYCSAGGPKTREWGNGQGMEGASSVVDDGNGGLRYDVLRHQGSHARRAYQVKLSPRRKNHFLTHPPRLACFSALTHATVPISMPNFWWHLYSITATC